MTARMAGEIRLGLLLAPLVRRLHDRRRCCWLRPLLPDLRKVPENPLRGAGSVAGRRGFALLLVAIVAGGMREEVQRAFLLHRFRADLGGAAIGLILTSVGFGIGHLVQGWDAMIVVTAALGAFWGLSICHAAASLAGVSAMAGQRGAGADRVLAET